MYPADREIRTAGIVPRDSERQLTRSSQGEHALSDAEHRQPHVATEGHGRVAARPARSLGFRDTSGFIGFALVLRVLGFEEVQDLRVRGHCQGQ